MQHAFQNAISGNLQENFHSVGSEQSKSSNKFIPSTAQHHGNNKSAQGSRTSSSSWNDKHAITVSRNNEIQHLAYREYFDTPREMRI
jgi:hypothetical protein